MIRPLASRQAARRLVARLERFVADYRALAVVPPGVPVAALDDYERDRLERLVEELVRDLEAS